MAKIDLVLGDYTYSLSFVAKDLFMTSTLGCHAGSFGNFTSSVQKKGASFTVLNETVMAELLKAGLLRRIMDKLVGGADTAWGSGFHYSKKAHWMISTPWNMGTSYVVAGAAEFRTAEIMDLIMQFCDHEPNKYGTYVVTDGTDCAAHYNNSGKPCTRTLIWHPPYVGKAPEVLKTRVSGLVAALYAPKPKPVPKPKVVKIKPPRPVRKVHNVKKAQPKTFGPAPRVKYKRAA